MERGRTVNPGKTKCVGKTSYNILYCLTMNDIYLVIMT